MPDPTALIDQQTGNVVPALASPPQAVMPPSATPQFSPALLAQLGLQAPLAPALGGTSLPYPTADEMANAFRSETPQVATPQVATPQMEAVTRAVEAKYRTDPTLPLIINGALAQPGGNIGIGVNDNLIQTAPNQVSVRSSPPIDWTDPVDVDRWIRVGGGQIQDLNPAAQAGRAYAIDRARQAQEAKTRGLAVMKPLQAALTQAIINNPAMTDNQLWDLKNRLSQVFPTTPAAAPATAPATAPRAPQPKLPPTWNSISRDLEGARDAVTFTPDGKKVDTQHTPGEFIQLLRNTKGEQWVDQNLGAIKDFMMDRKSGWGADYLDSWFQQRLTPYLPWSEPSEDQKGRAYMLAQIQRRQ